MIEVGPGPGGLTRALLALGAARVIAIERDERAIAALAEIAEHYPGRLEIVAGDALTFDPRPISTAAARASSPICPTTSRPRCSSAGSRVEPWPPWYDRLVLMFQREVAERIVAAARLEDLWPAVGAGALAHARRRILFDVAPSAFVPPPKVTSSVVRLVAARRAARLRSRERSSA